jgi:hypothetical protein
LGTVKSSTISNLIANSAPDIAAKTPDKWTTDDINRIIKILSTEPGHGSLGQQLQNLRNAVTALHLAGILGGALLLEPAGWVAVVGYDIVILYLGIEVEKAGEEGIAQQEWNFCKNNPKAQGCDKFIIVIAK